MTMVLPSGSSPLLLRVMVYSNVSPRLMPGGATSFVITAVVLTVTDAQTMPAYGYGGRSIVSQRLETPSVTRDRRSRRDDSQRKKLLPVRTAEFRARVHRHGELRHAAVAGHRDGAVARAGR